MAVLENKAPYLALIGLQPATTPSFCWQVLAVLATSVFYFNHIF